MNRNIAFAIILAATGNAFADDITLDTTPFTSTATRAEVQADLLQYRKAGVNPWSQAYNPLAQFKSSSVRSQVTADFLAARDAVAAFGSEDSGSSYLAGGEAQAARRLAGQPANGQ